jgi:spore coat polysaccharide biosynthesis protein SpsF
VTTSVQPSYPAGIDVQVFRFESLADVARNIDDPAVREHVSLYFYEHPERYRILHLTAPEPCRAPGQRLLLDYPEDQQLIREIYRHLEPRYGSGFGTAQILELLAAMPELAAVNRLCVEKPGR